MEKDDTYRDTKEAVIRYVQVETDLERREGVLHGSQQFGSSDCNSGQCHVASAHVRGPEDGPATTQIGEFDDPGLNVVTQGKGKGKPFSGHGH